MKIQRRTDNGFYLTEAGEGNPPDEVLLPNKFITPEMKLNDIIRVFLYKDSEDRPVATTQNPKAVVGEANYLFVKEVNNIGAFLDWGLDKDLFLPYREQAESVEPGRHYLVYVYFDYASKRISATTNLNKFIKNREVNLQPNQEVDILITYENETGIRVIVNNMHWGMLFKNEIFGTINKGERMKGFVKKVREDGKIDIALQKQGIAAARESKDMILNLLKENKGILKLSDNSSPDEIYRQLGMSKKNFKKTVGMLFKEGKLELGDDYIRLRPGS